MENPPADELAPGRAVTLANVAEGAEALVTADLARAVAARPKPPAVSLAVVCRDGARMQQLARALDFFAPDLTVMQFPAWDCPPYHRASPHGGRLAQPAGGEPGAPRHAFGAVVAARRKRQDADRAARRECDPAARARARHHG